MQGDADIRISGIATLARARPGELSFYHNKRYHADLLTTRASVVILHPAEAAHCPVACLFSDNPYQAYARASHLFSRAPQPEPGIHPSACIHPDARVGAGVSIGPLVSIAADCEIGEGSIIHSGVSIGAGCRIGSNCLLHAKVSLYHDVRLGDRVTVHASAVLGADGFGFAPGDGHYEKIEQLGGLRIGDDVEIGAATTIDRGALDDTVIGNGVKIDNQVQIAHNVVVGDNTVICGCSAIAGSSVIGKNCIIAGAVGVVNHVTICDGVTVTAMSLVNQSITEAGTWSSGTGLDRTANWKKNIVRFRQLDDIWKRLLRLEE